MSWGNSAGDGSGDNGEITLAEENFIINLAGIPYQAGDLIYYSGTSLTRLGIGNSGSILTVSSGIPSWVENALSFNSLSDVLITSPSPQQFIQYDGSKWVNNSFGDFKELSDTPSLPPSDVMRLYTKDDGGGATSLYMLDSEGIETSLIGGGGGATNLDALTDVTISGESSNQVLQYNSGTNQWENITLAHSTLSGIGTNTHAQIDTHIANTSNPHSVTVAQIGAVATTGDETVAGVKTFSSIPLGPASDPDADDQLVRKAYVDSVALGLSVRQSCRVATTVAGTLASSFENGDTVDGIVLVTDDRILVKNQAAGTENGIYTVNASGAPTRATDYDVSGEVQEGTFTSVLEGTVNANTQWVQVTIDPTLGVSSLSFSKLSSQQVYTASLGVQKVSLDFRADVSASGTITLSGNKMQVAVDDSSIERSGNALRVKALGITNAMLAGSIGNTKLDTVGIAKGGTNITTYVAGDILYASSADVLAKLPISTNGFVLTLAAGIPAWVAPTGGGGAGVNSLTYSKSLDTSVTTATISNSATETTLYSYTVAANALGTSKVLRVVVSGTYLNNSAANRTVTIKLKYGATTIINVVSGAIITSATVGTFTYTFLLMAHGSASVQQAYFTGTHETGTSVKVLINDAGTAAINSAVSQSLVVTAQLSAATATQTLTKRFASINMDNATDTVGSPSDAQYVVLSVSSDLSAERVLTGTANEIVITDNGAGSTVVLSLGANAITTTNTKTLTNKRITQRVQSVANAATITPNADAEDAVDITAIAQAFTIANATGTPTNFQKLIIRIKDNGTARGITWGNAYTAGGVALPSTTVLSKILNLGFIWNSANTLNKWQLVASSQEA